ncbi:hypothetical protein MNV_560061 [Candidatus Methanoperedens nitroreducens]|uniref:Uncharacterized protein n=1 Tax=Candidatus Methanoperedens nitratireducens TaxID=1392998 RepID=A0A284VRU9_9EURY|nr:hypothetical protein MNV_560061 [Candidatus Methanoperedens nitroreducens]
MILYYARIATLRWSLLEYVTKGLKVIQPKSHRQKVVSEAEKRGIDKEQVLCDFQHLKMQGEVYESKSGEIRYVF